METTTYQLKLAQFSEAPSQQGILKVAAFSFAQRFWRATRYFFIFLALAFCSVFIPALHFVLVPLFSFLAPTAAAFAFLQLNEVSQADGVCPYCLKKTTLSRARLESRFRDSCEHCRQLIEITNDLSPSNNSTPFSETFNETL